MKNIVVVFLMMLPLVVFSEEAPSYMSDILRSRIKDVQVLASNEVLVRSVEAQNAEHLDMSEIMKRDDAWRKGDSELFFQQLQSEAGKKLKEFVNTTSMYSESILMDSLGANVAVFPGTSDYWQGDEANFVETYDNGLGKTFIENLKYDESTRVFSVDIGVPVKSENRTIGALIVGVKWKDFAHDERAKHIIFDLVIDALQTN